MFILLLIFWEIHKLSGVFLKGKIAHIGPVLDVHECAFKTDSWTVCLCLHMSISIGIIINRY